MPNRRRDKRFMASSGENKFLELMDVSMQGILIHDYDFRPLFVNQSYANELGYSIDEIMSFVSVDKLYAVNEARRLRSYLQERLIKFSRDVPPSIYDVEARHKLGDSVILQNAVSLIEWQGVPAVLILASDITEQHLSRQALETSEERFRDFAESASDCCWEMDENFRYTYLSDSFERFAGSNKQDLLGKTNKEFMSEYVPDMEFSEEEKNLLREYSQMLKKHVSYTNFECLWYTKAKGTVHVSMSGKPVFNNVGKFIGYRGTATNITEQKKLSEQLNFQASHDELTGLVNRRYFDNELSKAIDDALINDSQHVLVFMDMDRFKIVNDTCGHVAGDELLQQLADIFRKVFSKRDILGRLGGDEFAVIMKHCTIEQSVRITDRLHDEISRFRFVWDGRSFGIGVSAGVASINRDCESVSLLLKNVDSACYMAKQTGRNKTQIFSENDEDLSKRKGEMHWAGRITEALEKDDFVLYAQAIHSLQSSEQVFYELLIRMVDGDNIIAPNLFLPAAERYDLSLNIDKWVLRKALSWISENIEILLKTRLVFINLSGKTVGKKTFLDYAINMLQEYQIPPEKICFEITETTAIANLAEAVSFIQELKKIGCFFAIDDFGSGVSSFAYLKNLPVDYLKIDGMFIRDMSNNAVNLAMVRSINEISHVMGKQTIAEFVEDEATFAILRNMGVDYAQGYAIGRPFPLSEIEESQEPHIKSG